MLGLRRLAEFLRDDEDAFIKSLTDKTNGDILKEQEYLEDEINRALARNDKVSGLYEKLFEDHAENKASEEWFMHMSQKYETERLELRNKISRLRKGLAEADELKIGQEQFVAAIRRFLEVQVLTRPLLQELIDHIDVFETEGVGKSRTQRVARCITALSCITRSPNCRKISTTSKPTPVRVFPSNKSRRSRRRNTKEQAHPNLLDT